MIYRSGQPHKDRDYGPGPVGATTQKGIGGMLVSDVKVPRGLSKLADAGTDSDSQRWWNGRRR